VGEDMMVMKAVRRWWWWSVCCGGVVGTRGGEAIGMRVDEGGLGGEDD
jgi:hypothetical protein